MKILGYIKKYKLVLIVLSVVTIGGVYWYNRSHAPQTLISKVEKHIQLPTNESPAVATVSDDTKLKSQQFFSDAENGDVLLIFNTSQKAILYRPSIDKIINVTTINIHTAAPIQSAAPTSVVTEIKTSTVTVAIYNGTQIAGLATRMEQQLQKDMPNMKVVTKTNASANYTDNLVIDITGKNKNEADSLAEAIDGIVAKLPEGEQKPAADILIILGKNL